VKNLWGIAGVSEVSKCWKIQITHTHENNLHVRWLSTKRLVLFAVEFPVSCAVLLHHFCQALHLPAYVCVCLCVFVIPAGGDSTRLLWGSRPRLIAVVVLQSSYVFSGCAKRVPCRCVCVCVCCIVLHYAHVYLLLNSENTCLFFLCDVLTCPLHRNAVLWQKFFPNALVMRGIVLHSLSVLAVHRTMQIDSRPTEIITYFWKQSGDMGGCWVRLVQIILPTRVTVRVRG